MVQLDLYKEWGYGRLMVCLNPSSQLPLSSTGSLICVLRYNLKISRNVWGVSPMPLTKSVDYAIVMEGELEMHLDDESCTILHQGILRNQRTPCIIN